MASKRKLTQAEIDSIVEVIPRVSAASQEVAEHNHREIKHRIALQLSEVLIVPSQIDKLRTLIYNRCLRAASEPGDTVGLQAAEAIGAPVTQATLNSFHHSGSTDVGGSGLQIFSELLSLSSNRKNPRVEIHFKNNRISYRDAVNLSRAFVAVSLRSLLTHPVSGVAFVKREKGEEVPSFYPMFTAFMRYRRKDPEWSIPDPGDDGVSFLRLTFAPDKLFSTRVTTAEIGKTIELLGGTLCVYSPSYLGIVDVYGVPFGRKALCTIKPSDIMKASQVADAAISTFENEFKKGAEPGVKGKDTVAKVLEGIHDKSVAADAKRKERLTKKVAKKAKQKHGFEKVGQKSVVEDAAAKRVKKAIDKLKEEPDEAPQASSGISPENAPILFLQTCVVPRIRDDSFVVSSQVAQVSVAKLLAEDEIVPSNAKLLSLFRRVDIVVTRTLEIARGASKLSDRVWRVWISTPAVFAKCVPREKLVGLFECVYPNVVVTLVYNRENGDDWVDLKFPKAKSENPFVEVQGRVAAASAEFVKSVRGNLAAASQVQRAPELIWGEYVSLRGKMNYAPVLSSIISHPAVDGRTTFSNNFQEMCQVRGIEAARASILKEFYDIIIATGSSIVPRNVQIVVDVMTSSGALMPFTARGSVRQQLGAYSESSFEQALSAFRRSAVSGAPENVSATSTSILTGSIISLGTGVCRVVAADGVYRKPAYLDLQEEDAPIPPDDTASPPQGVVLAGAPIPPEPPVVVEASFGSMKHPPPDADFMIGTLSTRDFLEALESRARGVRV